MCNLDLKSIKSFLRNKKVEKIIRALLIILLFGFFIWVQLYIIKLFFPVIGNVFKSNFDEFTYTQLIASITYSIVLIIFSYFTIIIYDSVTKTETNKWFYWTVILIIIFILLGFVFVNAEFGVQPLTFRLREAGHIENVLGNITCRGLNPQILAGERAICSVEPQLKIISAELITTDAKGEGSQIDILGKERMNFTAPIGNIKLQFNIDGFDSKGNKQFLSTTSVYDFLTKEEYDKRREKLLTYLLGLFFIALFSIPAMMVNLKKLRE